jgi:hypothetical protein
MNSIEAAFTVGAPRRDEPQDLDFAMGHTARERFVPRRARHTSSAWLGAELLNNRVRGIELELSGVLIAETAVGLGAQQPG